MVAQAPTPILLNNVVLQIATDNYEASVSQVQFDPTVPQVVWKGMTPSAIYPMAGTPTWKLTLGYPQDAANTASLSEYLRTNNGTQKTVVFKPLKPASGTAPTYTCDVIIAAGPLGGQIDTVAAGTVQMDCVGQPIRSVA